jgi:hypothetical protein
MGPVSGSGRRRCLRRSCPGKTDRLGDGLGGRLLGVAERPGVDGQRDFDLSRGKRTADIGVFSAHLHQRLQHGVEMRFKSFG